MFYLFTFLYATTCFSVLFLSMATIEIWWYPPLAKENVSTLLK